MRKKVRKSLAFLLALALVVSVMSGLGLSVSADDAQNEPVVTETEGEPAEEKPKVEESTPKEGEEEEEADPDAEAVPEEKKDEQKAEGEGSGEKAAENKVAETPKAGENVQTATIGTGDKTVTVKTTAAAGVLPEGAKLVVKKLANQDQAYQDAESTLKDSQVTYDDFLALDVGFEVNGKEVEPEAGSVQVQFELGAGLLPETADTNTLAVQHLTDGKAEMVADAGAVTTGDVTVKNEVVKADFEVQSFSTFTITWSGWSTYFQVTVHYVDESGGEIDATHSGMPISNGEAIEFASEARTIKGYTYQNAHYGTYTGEAVTKVEASGGDGLFSTRYLTFYNGNAPVKKLTRSSLEETKTANVYLVYKADETGGGGTGGEIVQEQELTRRKWVEYNEADDTYDLSLSVSGAKGTQANPAKLDIVLVLDVSSSMQDRIGAVKTAANSFISTVGENEAISAQYKVITFGGQGGENDTAAWLKTNGWVAANSAVKVVENIQIGYNVGTNYEAGITLATSELGKNARSGAQKVVVFFSDGEPTFRSTYDNGYGNGQNDNGGKNLNAAVNAAKKLTCDYFYCIGTGTAKLNNLQTLANAANATTKGAQTTSNVDKLTGIFKDIAAKITTFLCTDVTVTDVLSDNVQMVMGSDNQPKKLVVTVKDKSGNTVATPAGITASYDAAQKKIVMDFPDDYKLNPEYTYIVTATIEATEKAYENYRANGNAYPDTGEADTGVTSAGKEGVFSNKDGEAKVTYEYNKKPGEAKYPMPVIQLHPGTLIVKKNITGDLTEAEKTALVNKMTVDVKIKGNENKVPLRAFTPGNDGTYTFTFNGLSPNTAYSVTESGADVEGYELTTTPSTLPVSGSVAGDATETVSITNNYTRAVQNLTITKAVSGEDKAFVLNVSGIDYTFTITPGKGVTVKDGKYGNATFNNNKGTVTIRGENRVTIPGLPVGTYTVRENGGSDVPEGYDFDTNSTEMSGTATLTNTNAGFVTITNKYKIKELKVTVKKEVTGNMGDTNQEFSFNDGKFKLKNNGTKEFTVKYGEAFTVTETDADQNGYTTSYKVDDGDAKDGGTCAIDAIKADTTITFTNKKQINPPNGITTTIAPYAIMVVLAAGAGVYFVYSRRRRNR